MTITYYPPLSDAIPSGFTDSGGDLFSRIDESPLSPNLADYIEQNPGFAGSDTVSFGMGAIAAPDTGLSVFLYSSFDAANVYCSGITLLDNAFSPVANYAFSYLLNSAASLNVIPLTYIPGSYDLSACTLALSFTWDSGTVSTLKIYAMALAVGNDIGVGPGGQRARNASFHQMLCGQ